MAGYIGGPKVKARRVRRAGGVVSGRGSDTDRTERRVVGPDARNTEGGEAPVAALTCGTGMPDDCRLWGVA